MISCKIIITKIVKIFEGLITIWVESVLQVPSELIGLEVYIPNFAFYVVWIKYNNGPWLSYFWLKISTVSLSLVAE